MKIKLVFVCLLFLTSYIYGQSRGSISLDDAIYNSAMQIQEGIGNRSTIVVYQFQFENKKLSDYILNELFDLLVNSRKFIVLDRSAQDVINAEIDFQFNQSANMISDDSLASLTKRIGANAIVTGSLDDAGDEYRFRIRVIGTETTAAIVSYVGRVNKNDKRITAFMGKERSSGAKIGTGALNIILGLGSYLEGDIAGGLTITAGYAIAAGLIVVEATMLDWDNPAVGLPATAGVCIAGVTLVYGFARPFIYNRSPKLASPLDKAKTDIVFTSDNTGRNYNIGIQLTHTIKF